MRTWAIALAALATLWFAAPASAQTVTTIGYLKLHRLPANASATIRVLTPGETLSVTNPKKQKGFLAVRTSSGDSGFVGAKHVQEIGASAIAPETTATAASLITDTGGKPFTRIDSTWPKPTPQNDAIEVQGGALSCQAGGDGGDTGTNRRKNREDVPAKSYLIDVSAILALKDKPLWRHGKEAPRSDWTPSDLALVTPFEGIPVTVEGYFNIVKPQAGSAPKPGKKVGESTNCHSWLETDTDWHVALVSAPSDSEEHGVVVEPTPRSKRANPAWSVTAARAIAVRSSAHATPQPSNAKKVRVTGFLMLDPAHPNHIRAGCASLPTCKDTTFYRATLWEVHPVTRIQILSSGKWTDLGKPSP